MRPYSGIGKRAKCMIDVKGVLWDLLGVNAESKDFEGEHDYFIVRVFSDQDEQLVKAQDMAIELSDCPCDPRRRHERLGQRVAVV